MGLTESVHLKVPQNMRESVVVTRRFLLRRERRKEVDSDLVPEGDGVAGDGEVSRMAVVLMVKFVGVGYPKYRCAGCLICMVLLER